MDEANKRDELEHIVQEAAEKAQFTYDPAAWTAMEQKLKGVEKTPFAWWKVLFPIGVVVLLVILFWPGGNAGNEDKTEPVKTAQTEKEIESGSSPAVEESKEVPSSESGSEEGSGSSTEAVSEAGNELGGTAPDGQTDSNQALANRLVSVDEPLNEAIAEEAVSAGSSESTPVVSQTKQTVSLVLGLAPIMIERVPPTFDLGDPDLIFVVDSSQFKQPVEDSVMPRKKWSVGLVVSADLSATGLEGFTDPGTMFGVTAEYYLARNWSIQTGLTYSIKKYNALGSEYEVPEWALNAPDVLTAVAANCKVIDIPINIRRYFTTSKGKTYFASAGVSTYLMLREDYDYTYSENRPAWPNQWSIENRNNHLLGILNVSGGYETPIGKNLGLGIEPFVKLPLTGIGEGRVHFLSFGTNVSIKLWK